MIDLEAIRLAAGVYVTGSFQAVFTLGVTRWTLNAIELGKYSRSLEVAFRIAEVFGVPLEQVFEYQGGAGRRNARRSRG